MHEKSEAEMKSKVFMKKPKSESGKDNATAKSPDKDNDRENPCVLLAHQPLKAVVFLRALESDAENLYIP